MTRSGPAPVNLLKCQYFDQMAFLLEKSVNKVTETNLSQRSTSSTEVLTEESQCYKKRRTDSMQPGALAQSVKDCDEMVKRSLTEENDRDFF